MSKLGTGALIVAGAGLAAYGFYEAGSSLLEHFNNISSPFAANTVRNLSAAFGAVVGAAGLGTYASKKWCEIQGAILTLVFGAAGALGGGIAGWHIADKALQHNAAHSPSAIVQPAQAEKPVLTQ